MTDPDGEQQELERIMRRAEGMGLDPGRVARALRGPGPEPVPERTGDRARRSGEDRRARRPA